MTFTKEPVHGIDVPLQELQTELHAHLLATFSNVYTGITEDDIMCYGRAYKMATQQGYRPEVYMGELGYKEVLFDDRWAIQTFFGNGDTDTAAGEYLTTPVHLVCFMNLARCFRDDQPDAPPVNTRADVEARLAVEAFMSQNIHGFTYTNTTRGLAAIFAEYTAVKTTNNGRGDSGGQNMLKADMHPFHCFRINGTLRYRKPSLNNSNYF